MVMVVVVRSVQRPSCGQRAVLVLPATHGRQAAATSTHTACARAARSHVAPGVSRGAVGHGRAGRVGKACRGVGRSRSRTSRSGRAAAGCATPAIRGAVGGGLGPAWVGTRSARVIAGPAARPLKVGQAGQHGAHARGGHVDRGAGCRGGSGRRRCGVHEAAGRAVVSGGPLAGQGGEGLVHFLRLLGREGAQFGAPAGPQQLAGGRGLIEVSEEQQVLPSRQGATGACDPGRRGSVGSGEGMRGVGAEQERAARRSRHRLGVELRRPAVAGAAGTAIPAPGAGGGRRRDGGKRRGGLPRWKGPGVAGVRSSSPETLRQAPAAVSQGHPLSGATPT